MKRNFIQAGAAVALLAAAVSTPTVALGHDKCDDPKGMIETRACAKAAQGPDALRRFVSRTQAIWHLYFYDYVQPDRTKAAAAPAAPHATAAAQEGNVAVAAKSR